MFNRIIFLSIMASLGVISASLCAPALPFIADHFRAHFSYIQFTISLFLIGNAFGQFFSGPLSDQLGKRTVLLGGLLLYILASCGCAMSSSMGWLLASRLFQGMGSSVGPVLARAITSSSFPPKKAAQVQSYNAIGIGVASILAIVSSGQLTLVSWRGNFILAAGLGLVLFLWAFIALKDTTENKAPFRQIFSPMALVWKSPQFISSTFCHSMTYGLMYGYIALFPFLLIEFFHEKNPVQVATYSAYIILFYMLGAAFSSQFLLRLTAHRLILVGLICQLFGGVGMALSSHFLPFFISLSVFNFSIGIILPVTAASALSPFIGKAVGTASSCLGSTYRLVGSILSILICQLPLAGGRFLGLSIFILSLISVYIHNRSCEITVSSP